MIDDYTFEFTLEKPADVTVLINALHVLTHEPEKEKPDPGEENVLF